MINGDVSTALTLLMRYPAMDDISPIVAYADMIRRLNISYNYTSTV